MRRRFLLLPITLLAAVAGILLIGSMTSDEHCSVNTPATYSRAMDHFPHDMRLIAPLQLPANAIDVRGELSSSHGLGPSSTRLLVSFTVPPAEAAAMLAHAKALRPLGRGTSRTTRSP
jgi:hypothetical protein